MTGVYYEVSIATGNRRTMKDILIAEMSEIGFDSFVDSENGFLSYAQEENFSEPTLLKVLQENGYSEKPEIKRIEPQNWNAVWESQFDPILVNNEICIRAPFHDEMPGYKYELVIEPKMSFGTGHHATTRLMCQALSKVHPEGKNVCDMGCGTGILGILAMKMGARSAFAVDIEAWAVENSKENAQKNQVEMQVLEGGKEHLQNKQFDIILANINRNVLLDQLGIYAQCLSPGGQLLLSGFLEPDVQVLLSASQDAGFSPDAVLSEENWRCIVLIKS